MYNTLLYIILHIYGMFVHVKLILFSVYMAFYGLKIWIKKKYILVILSLLTSKDK